MCRMGELDAAAMRGEPKREDLLIRSWVGVERRRQLLVMIEAAKRVVEASMGEVRFAPFSCEMS